MEISITNQRCWQEYFDRNRWETAADWYKQGLEKSRQLLQYLNDEVSGPPISITSSHNGFLINSQNRESPWLMRIDPLMGTPDKYEISYYLSTDENINREHKASKILTHLADVVVIINTVLEIDRNGFNKWSMQ